MNHQGKYRSDIDGLRAISIIFVILYHAKIFNSFAGFIGVDIFFVISGYLITKQLFTEMNEQGQLSYLNFFSRRIRRLYPAIIVLIFTIIIIWSFLFIWISGRTDQFIRSIGYAISGFANVFFQRATIEYFADTSDKMPLLHFWSLSVEEQFYFVWPWIIIVVFNLTKKFSLTEKFNLSFQKNIVLTILFIIFSSFIGSVLLIKTGMKNEAFYLMPARAWELGIGGLLVFIEISFSRNTFYLFCNRKYFFSLNLSIFGLFFIFLSAIKLSTLSFPYRILLPTLGAALIIFAGANENKISNFLSCKILVKIGKISYGLYLWHWPLLSLLRIYHLNETPPLWQIICIVFISFLLASLSLRLVEDPIRRNKNFGNYATLCSGVLSCFILIALANSMSLYRKLYPNSLSELIAKRTPLLSDCVDKIENIGSNLCTVLPKEGSKSIKSHIFVWGDSFSYAIFPMISSYINTNTKTVSATLFSTSGIPSLLNVPHLEFGKSKDDTIKLNQINTLILDEIRKNVKANANVHYSVILSSYWLNYFPVNHIKKDRDSFYLTESDKAEDTLHVMQDSLYKTISELEKIGISRILILTPWPEFPNEISECAFIKGKTCEVPIGKMEKYIGTTTQMFKFLSENFADVKLIHPLNFLCTPEECSQIIKNDQGKHIPVVFDFVHPSVDAAEFLARKIQPELNWLTN